MCRLGPICASPVELPYYSADIGRLDICSLCGATEAVVYDELKAKYRTVLTICITCTYDGKTPSV